MIQKIGMIGVGRMGLAIARNLTAKGYPVTGYRSNAIDDFIAAGGIAATSSAEVVAAADIVFTSLPENAAVSDALNRTDGILAVLKPGQIVVETTSLPPADKRIHAALVADAGAVMLDCPLSAARRACSKQAALSSSCRGTVRYPTTSTMYWKRSVRAARGSATSVRGAASKSVATALVAIHNLASAEGLAIAAREGGDIKAVHEAIAGSPAGSAIFEMRGALMAKREYASGGGSLDGYLRALVPGARRCQRGWCHAPARCHAGVVPGRRRCRSYRPGSGVYFRVCAGGGVACPRPPNTSKNLFPRSCTGGPLIHHA